MLSFRVLLPTWLRRLMALDLLYIIVCLNYLDWGRQVIVNMHTAKTSCLVKVTSRSGYSNFRVNWTNECILPYTRVNKRIRLFSKLQGNMHLIMKGKIWPHPATPLVARVTWQHTRQVKRTRKLSVLTWCSLWNLQRVWAVMPWQTSVLVLMKTVDVDEDGVES